MTIGMTFRQDKLLAFIRRRTDETGGVSPTFDEMKDAMGLASKSNIHRILSGLEERGLIRRLSYRARAIEVLAPEIDDALSEFQQQIAHLPSDSWLQAGEVRTIVAGVRLARTSRNERRSDRGLPSGRAA